MFKKLLEDKRAISIVQKLQDLGYLAFYAGGCIRDSFLGVNIKDIDIVTSAHPNKVCELFPQNYPIGAAFGIIAVVMDGETYEVATFREEREYSDGRRPDKVFYTDDPQKDAIRRDFTINGMFYDPINKELYDYVGGLEDLEKRVIRTIGSPAQRFAEDYLRMLRAIRFSVRLGFEIVPDVFATIKSNALNIKKLSVERIREELNGMFKTSQPDKAIELLAEADLLDQILPEVVKLKGVSQPPHYHPEGDVYVHTLLALKNIEEPDYMLAWAALLHDIGKPNTFFKDEQGVEHFYGHERVGAKIAEDILTRLRFSNHEVEAITLAVRNHMKFVAAPDMKTSTWKKFVREKHFPLYLAVHKLDALASNGYLEFYQLMKDRFEKSKEEPEVKLLISGKDLIGLGLKPGKEFKKILGEILDLQLEGTINDRSDAINYVKENYLQ